MSKNRGISLLSLVVSIGLIAAAMMIFVVTQSNIRRQSVQSRDQIEATQLAAELLEFLLSHNAKRLKSNLSTNPVSGSSTPADQYPLCANINILDREGSRSENRRIILNRDPLAELSPSRLDGAKPWQKLNRFYLVQIVNIRTLAAQNAQCNAAPSTINLAPDERYQVTVGVSWLPIEQRAANYSGPILARRAVLSAVIP